MSPPPVTGPPPVTTKSPPAPLSQRQDDPPRSHIPPPQRPERQQQERQQERYQQESQQDALGSGPLAGKPAGSQGGEQPSPSPVSLNPSAAVSSVGPPTPGSSLAASTPIVPPPTSAAADWIEYKDPTTGFPYYYNKITQETLWEKPAGMKQEVPPPPQASLDGIPESKSDIKPGWVVKRCQGTWADLGSGKSSQGGCYPNFRTWRNNPQYMLYAPKGPTQLQIELRWSGPSALGDSEDLPALGFYLFKNDGPGLQKLCVTKKDTIARSEFSSSGSVSVTTIIQVTEPSLPDALADWEKSSKLTPFPSHYTIIPSTFQPKISGSFQLSVHSSAPIYLKPLPKSGSWQQSFIDGVWKGPTAGGCRNNGSWGNNPQFELILQQKEPIQRLVLILSQEASSAMAAIGFYVISCQSGQIVGKGTFMLAPEVYCELDVDVSTGPYIVIPCTFDPGIEANFTLTVFSRHGAGLVQCS